MILFPISDDLVVGHIEESDEIIMTLRSASPTAPCPWCGTQSQQVQSRYTRRLADLPFSGRRVHLVVHVRRFFCKKSTCARKIFAEQFPTLALPHAQRTLRLQKALRSVGFLLGGKPGKRLGALLGYSGSADTILRLVRGTPHVPASSPHIIGLDDWAWRKRQRYGTIIVDQEQHRVIDLLADRKVETVKAWLQAHPTVKMVTRDRSDEYAAAITQGAPHALQIADRFHLTVNLRETLQTLLARLWKDMQRKSQPAEAPLPEEDLPDVELWRPQPLPHRETIRLARQNERADRYEQVVALQKRGFTTPVIADRLGVSQRTVRRWLAQGTLTFTRRRRKKPSHFDRYATYVLRRWKEGCRNGLQLWREIKAQGYSDSHAMVYQYLRALRAGKIPDLPEDQAFVLEAMTLRDAVWLFLRDPNKLEATRQEQLEALREASFQVNQAYQLVQGFLQMLRQRTGDQLEAWLDEVTKSQIPELIQFAEELKADQSAVTAGLTLPWSNGMVEGNVNRLKLIKRSMYGRAQFNLLRQRVLYRSEQTSTSPSSTPSSKGQKEPSIA